MKKTTFNLLRSSMMILMLCFGLTSAWGQGSENFDNATDVRLQTKLDFS